MRGERDAHPLLERRVQLLLRHGAGRVVGECGGGALEQPAAVLCPDLRQLVEQALQELPGVLLPLLSVVEREQRLSERNLALCDEADARRLVLL